MDDLFPRVTHQLLDLFDLCDQDSARISNDPSLHQHLDLSTNHIRTLEPRHTTRFELVYEMEVLKLTREGTT